MRRFGRAREFGELLADQVTPAVVTERVGRQLGPHYVENRPSGEACEERAFRDAIGVEVSETGHGLGHDGVQVPVIYVAVGPVYAVLR